MRLTSGSDSLHKREEQMPMKPRESEHPVVQTVQTRKITIKGHRPNQAESSKQSEENLLREGDRSDQHPRDEDNAQGEKPAREEAHIKPKRNNLIGGSPEQTDGSKVASHGRLNMDASPGDLPAPAVRSGELPPVKAGKVPVRRNFKPAEVQQQDFEGM